MSSASAIALGGGVSVSILDNNSVNGVGLVIIMIGDGDAADIIIVNIVIMVIIIVAVAAIPIQPHAIHGVLLHTIHQLVRRRMQSACQLPPRCAMRVGLTINNSRYCVTANAGDTREPRKSRAGFYRHQCFGRWPAATILTLPAYALWSIN